MRVGALTVTNLFLKLFHSMFLKLLLLSYRDAFILLDKLVMSFKGYGTFK